MRFLTRHPAAVLACVAVVAACSNPVSADRVPPPGPDQITYAASLGITLSQFTKQADGVYTQDQVPGTGALVASGDSVALRYKGWLPSGFAFDSTLAGGTPFKFKLGAGRVIKGFDSGVIGMRVGGTRRIIIPAPLAYGAAGSPPNIPPNAVLIFSLNLVEKY